MPSAPGTAQETEARVHVQKLSEQLRNQFLIDFKPGASTIIGLAFVSKAAPDGYTLLLAGPSFTLLPLRTIPLPFDPLRAFLPISLLSKRWTTIVVHPSLPSTPSEFISYAKANPGKVNFGTNGVGGGSHLTGAWLADATRIEMTFIHYKSAALMIPDLIAGRVHITPFTMATALPLVKSGKLKFLGLTNSIRNPAAPDLPTLTEQGIQDVEYSSWLGVLAPEKTPTHIINLLHSEIAKAVKSPDVIKRLSDETQLIGSTPEQFAHHINTETERWRKLVKEANISLE